VLWFGIECEMASTIHALLHDMVDLKDKSTQINFSETVLVKLIV
jgi:hypothetical protein